MKWRTPLGFLALSLSASAKVYDFEADLGAVAEDGSLDTAWYNGGLMNDTLAMLGKGDILLIPNRTYHLMGGIQGFNLDSVTIRLDGTLNFGTDHWDLKQWPRDVYNNVLACFALYQCRNFTLTSSDTGTLDGYGKRWWGIPGIGYLVRTENRPRLFTMDHSDDTLIENVLFLNSPYWTTYFTDVDGLEIRHSSIDARRTDDDGHSIIDMTAFNTDGFDVTGRNVWIHDCDVWNQDDCIAVKESLRFRNEQGQGVSSNMLFERIRASGVGLTIGSISSAVVQNITFRDCYMPHTYKGIYMKFRDTSDPGLIKDVTYENILIDTPSQWPIWIGPAQQSDTARLCAAHPCSICWPEMPHTTCKMPSSTTYENILLKNVTVLNPTKSPGVIRGNESNPMTNVIFEDVRVVNPGTKPWGDDYYDCQGVSGGVAKGSTWPVPPCFEDLTSGNGRS